MRVKDPASSGATALLPAADAPTPRPLTPTPTAAAARPTAPTHPTLHRVAAAPSLPTPWLHYTAARACGRACGGVWMHLFVCHNKHTHTFQHERRFAKTSVNQTLKNSSKARCTTPKPQRIPQKASENKKNKNKTKTTHVWVLLNGPLNPIKASPSQIVPVATHVGVHPGPAPHWQLHGAVLRHAVLHTRIWLRSDAGEDCRELSCCFGDAFSHVECVVCFAPSVQRPVHGPNHEPVRGPAVH